MPLIGKNFKNLPQRTLFFVIFLLGALAGAVPFRVDFLPTLFPHFAGMIVFHLYVLNKERASYVMLFLIAVVYDAINVLPLGSTVFIWLITIKILDYLRIKLLTSPNFILMLRDYIIFDLLNLVLQLIVIYFYNKGSYSFGILVKQWLLNIFVYVLLFKTLRKLEKLYHA